MCVFFLTSDLCFWIGECLSCIVGQSGIHPLTTMTSGTGCCFRLPLLRFFIVRYEQLEATLQAGVLENHVVHMLALGLYTMALCEALGILQLGVNSSLSGVKPICAAVRFYADVPALEGCPDAKCTKISGSAFQIESNSLSLLARKCLT